MCHFQLLNMPDTHNSNAGNEIELVVYHGFSLPSCFPVQRDNARWLDETYNLRLLSPGHSEKKNDSSGGASVARQKKCGADIMTHIEVDPEYIQRCYNNRDYYADVKETTNPLKLETSREH